MGVESAKERGDLFGRLASKLRHPYLFILLLLLFLVDLVIPDPIPLIDEAILGLLTVLFGNWKNRRKPQSQQDRTE